ncbi:MAG: HlyC/CorC family transporter [Nitrospirae bacterium]|nr:HlyC/CorC family transporter [Nitrospirota bacterium]
MWLEILLISIFILINGFFAASEIAVVVIRKGRIKQLMEEGRKNAAILNRLKETPDRFLATIQIGVTMAGALASAIGGAAAVRVIKPVLQAVPVPIISVSSEAISIGIIVVLITYFSLIFGELIPKSIALSNPEGVGLFIASIIDKFSKLAGVFVSILTASTNLLLKLFGKKVFTERSFITEEEVKMLIEEGGESGVFEPEEKEMLHNVFEFGDTEVSESMVPRTEIISIPEDALVKDALNLVSEKGYSRYPVIKETVDNIIGILYVKDILIGMSEKEVSAKTPIKDFIRDAYYIPASKMVTVLLDEMQKNKFHIAIVLDEHGGTAGLITLEDIMEEIVGGLQDEFEIMEAEQEVEVLDERTFIVSGSTGIDEVNELAGVDLTSKEFNTIGGFLFGLFGHLPKTGEQLRYHDLRFLILEMEGKKIEKIKITKL